MIYEAEFYLSLACVEAAKKYAENRNEYRTKNWTSPWCKFLFLLYSVVMFVLCWFPFFAILFLFFPVISVFKSPAGTEFHLDRKSI